MSTKEKILDELKTNEGASCSGEKLAQLCGVSRAAIWKAINSLRDEGYSITGTTNGGYILQDKTDVFSEEAFSEFFNKAFPQFTDSKVEIFKTIDSTNSYAKRQLSDAGNLRDLNGELTEKGRFFDHRLFLAEEQTAGRGRSGRTFVSPAKTGIYMSIIHAPKGGITNPAILTSCVAVAICRAIKKLYKIEASIKWINDIFYKGKKISGVLTEGITNFETGTIESAVIGLGVNICPNEVFSDELKSIAGSITDGSLSEDTPYISRLELAAQIYGEILNILQEDQKNIIEEYRRLSFIVGMDVEVHSLIDSSMGIYKAKAIGISDNAALIIQLPDGSTKEISSGEVSLKSNTFTN